MAKSQINRARAVRASHVKSRNGCQTCKIRRIRCDETLPLCYNCQSTGRKCEGPNAERFTFINDERPTVARRQSWGMSNSSSPDSCCLRTSTPTLIANHATDERRSFDFFVNRTAPLFAAGALNSAFWQNLVPQICHSDAVVWDAAIAIATLMEHPIARNHVVYRNGTDKAIKPQQLQALRWYSRAISGVKQRMNTSDAMASALLTCILFVCLEVQQGNTNNALNLVQHGVKLFADYLKIIPKDRPAGYRILDEVVIPFFSQHAIFLATFGLPLLSQAAQAAELTPSTISEEQDTSSSPIPRLKMQLYRLMFFGHELIRGASLIIEHPRELEIFKPRQISVLAELQQWRARFDTTMERDPCIRTDWAISFLLMHYQVTYIWVSICLSPEEIAADQHTDRFREVVSHAEKYLLLRPPDGADASSFEFGAEAIPPLYLTVTKCRHPEIRRRALSLIDRLPKSDTIWATLPVVTMLENVIAFEERNSSETAGNNCFPAEEDRVHHVQLFKTVLSPNLAARFVSFATDEDGRRTIKENIVALVDRRKLSWDEQRLEPISPTRLPAGATSMRLVMSPESFGSLSPGHYLTPMQQPVIENVA